MMKKLLDYLAILISVSLILSILGIYIYKVPKAFLISIVLGFMFWCFHRSIGILFDYTRKEK